jgi:hypothetical protein
MTDFLPRSIGRVESVLRDRAEAPRQGDEPDPKPVLGIIDEGWSLNADL